MLIIKRQLVLLTHHLNSSSNSSSTLHLSKMQVIPTVSFKEVGLIKELGKFDSSESKMSDITKKLSSMDSCLCLLEKSQKESNQKVQELENSRSFDNQSVDDLKSKQLEFCQ